MKLKYTIPVILILCLFSGCAEPNPNTASSVIDYAISPAGFFRGFWHGICAPFSFLGIMFGFNVGIYETFNTGNWYNFGFLWGCGVMGFGASRSTK